MRSKLIATLSAAILAAGAGLAIAKAPPLPSSGSAQMGPGGGPGGGAPPGVNGGGGPPGATR